MNKAQKEVVQASIDSEKAVLKELEKQYQIALKEIDEKIKVLNDTGIYMLFGDEIDRQNAQSKIYQMQYQRALRDQISGILDKLHSDEFTSIQQYLDSCYSTGFVGTMYGIANDGIPIVVPINQDAMIKAIQLDSKLSEPLYDSLGVDISSLKKTIRSEVSRGIASGLSYNDIARNIENVSAPGLKRAKTIARTEGHRVQESASQDARIAAKKKGADVVKQWDASLDGKTRDTHRRLDGQIKEIDEPFEMDGKKAMYPGEFGDPAEDCNCRCTALTRARAALDEDELQTLKDRAAYFGLTKEKVKDFADYKSKYLQASAEESKNKYDNTVVSSFVKTSKYRKMYNNLDESTSVQRTACKSAREMLAHRSGTKYEDLTFIDTVTGKSLTRADYNVENEVIPSMRMRRMVANADPYTIIAIHNHPGSSVPSITDLNTAYEKRYKYGVIACHNGYIMQYKVHGDFNEVIVDQLLDKANKCLYNISGTKEDRLVEILNLLESENVELEVFRE